MHGLGLCHEYRYEYEAALESLKRVAALDEASPGVMADHGRILVRLKRFEEAGPMLERALQRWPAHVGVLVAAADFAEETGQHRVALDLCERALRLDARSVEARVQLASTLMSHGRFDEAIAAAETATKINPGHPGAWNFLGIALASAMRLDEAEQALQRAVEIKPTMTPAWINHATVAQQAGRMKQARERFERALVLSPDHLHAHSSLLFTMSYEPDCRREDYVARARAFGQCVARLATPYDAWPALGGEALMAPQKLRLGFVSGDLREHPVGHFLSNVLRHLDPSDFELFAYSAINVEDALTTALRQRFQHWRSIAGLNDAAAAKAIHEDGLHVLIDLSGHTGNHRLPVFAWRPAPVQVTWLGYFASTGLREIDYIIVDRVSAPPEFDGDFTERPFALPESRLCYEPPTLLDVEVGELPASRQRFITFSCFQNFSKINDEVLRVWGRIFERLPEARLVFRFMQGHDPVVRRTLFERLAGVGIDDERCEIHGSTDRPAYLAGYRDIDIALDTFPFNGGTTTCDALWMGVPTVTLTGDTMISRQGASMMSCVDLADWVARTPDEYVEIAVAKAKDVEALQLLRQGLRDRASVSALFDGRRFAEHFTAAIKSMWQARASATELNGPSPIQPSRSGQ